jgi:hypothetical protein
MGKPPGNKGTSRRLATALLYIAKFDTMPARPLTNLLKPFAFRGPSDEA